MISRGSAPAEHYLSFRALSTADFPLLQRWLSEGGLVGDRIEVEPALLRELHGQPPLGTATKPGSKFAVHSASTAAPAPGCRSAEGWRRPWLPKMACSGPSSRWRLCVFSKLEGNRGARGAGN